MKHVDVLCHPRSKKMRVVDSGRRCDTVGLTVRYYGTRTQRQSTPGVLTSVATIPHGITPELVTIFTALS